MPEDRNMDVGRYYSDAYSKDEFVDIYKRARQSVYARMAHILHSFGVTAVIDVGCSVGLFVEELNRSGIDAYGVDLDIPRLREEHVKLNSAGKFHYGDVSTSPFNLPAECSAVTYLDTLRYIDNPKPPPVQYILIKESGAGILPRYVRRAQKDLHLYSPQSLLTAFPGYRMEVLFGPRERFALRRPSQLFRHLSNQLPAYTAVLRRRSA